MTLVVYIDFIPTLAVGGVEWGCLYTRARQLPENTLRHCKYVLIDQGIAAARRGLSEGELWAFYARAVARTRALNPQADVKAVAPDVFGSLERTLQLWERWAPRIERLGAVPVLVLQEPRRIAEWAKTRAYRDAAAVAVPTRFFPTGERCAHAPRACAEIVATATDVVALTDKKWLHLLGPPKRVLRLLRPLLGRTIRSIDGMGYRLATSKEVRVKKRPGGKGGYMVEPGLEETFLRAWLKDVFPLP